MLKIAKPHRASQVLFADGAGLSYNADVHLILLRHAEKEFSGPDPGLSTRGLAQAKALIKLIGEGEDWPTPSRILSSPKRRAQQTVQPLAETLKLKIDIRDDLDERRSHESNAGFRQRLRRLVTELEESTEECVVWCTHLDSIEELRGLADCESDLLDAPFDMWSPSQYLVLRLDDLWRVVEFGRAP